MDLISTTRRLLKTCKENSEIDGDHLNTNNFLLSGVFVPNVLMNVFFYLDSKSLMQARIVCKSWKNMIDSNVWYEKAKRYKKISYSKMTESRFNKFDVSLIVAYIVDKYDPFNKNMLRNVCGEEDFEYWEILPPHLPFMTVEDTPVGVVALPDHPDFEGHRSCFATSHKECVMEQVVDLSEYGINNVVMDYLFPLITVSEWYAGRTDAECSYKMIVTLLNEALGAIDTQTFTRALSPEEGNKWYKASITFKYYPPGVRYIRFIHGSRDTAHMEGFHGVKMAGCSLKLSCPPSFGRKVHQLYLEYYDDIPIFGRLIRW